VFKTPSPSLLLAQLKCDLRDAIGIDERIVRLVGHHLSRSRQVNHAIDDDQRDMDTVRPELARHRLRKATLRGLGWSKRCSLHSTATRRGKAIGVLFELAGG
jgi:hypothetical protein